MASAPTPPALFIDRDLPPVPGSYPSTGAFGTSEADNLSPVDADDSKEGDSQLPSLMRSNLNKLSAMNLGIESRRNTIGLDSLDSREGSEDGHGHVGSSKLGVDTDSRRNRRSSRESSVEVRLSTVRFDLAVSVLSSHVRP